MLKINGLRWSLRCWQKNRQYSLVFQFSQRGYVNTGVYNIESGQIKNGILTNDLFEGRDIKLVGSDDHYFIFVAEVPPKKKYSESLYNMLRE